MHDNKTAIATYEQESEPISKKLETSPVAGIVLGGADEFTSAGAANDANAKNHLADFLATLLIAAVVILFFAKTVFLGEPISKISLLAQWDSLYATLMVGANAASCDPSVVQLLVPSYFLVAKLWHSGVVPLWNAFSGVGCPLVGDIQATVFSPVRFAFNLFPSMQTYNLTLVFEVVLAAIGTFALARTLGLARYASVFAAITYAFCPYVLYYLELASGTSQALFPIVFLAFARLGNKPTFARACVCSFVQAALIMSGHPESSLFGIAFGSLLAFLLASPRVTAILKALFASYALAFGLSAPVTLPFLEYLGNSDSYKYAVKLSAYAPWQGIFYNLLQPGFGAASPYLGILAGIGIVLACIYAIGKKQVWSLLIVATIALVLMARISFVHDLLLIGPLKYLITVYCLPIFLLSATLISAFGVTELVESFQLGTNRKVLAVGIFVLASFLLPLSLKLLHAKLACGDFDMTVPSMHFDRGAFRHELIVMAALLLVLYGRRFVSGESKANWLTAVSVLAIALCGSASLASGSLPTQARFDFAKLEPVPFLQSRESRIIACGSHLLHPNLNVVYGISQLETHNPLYPRRFLKFVAETGAQVGEFTQEYADKGATLVPKFLDLASVRYAVSLLPVHSMDDAPAQLDQASTDTPINFQSRDVIALEKVTWRLDKKASEIFGQLSWKLSKRSIENYSYSLVLKDQQGNLVWFGDQHRFAELIKGKQAVAEEHQIILNESFAVPVPYASNANANYSLELQVFDWRTHQFISPYTEKEKIANIKDAVAHIATISGDTVAASQAAPQGNHFCLVSEFPNKARVYESESALPQAYIVRDVIWAHSEDQALANLKDKAFDLHKQVVLERAAAQNNIFAEPVDSAMQDGVIEIETSAEPEDSLANSSEAVAAGANKTEAVKDTVSFSREHPNAVKLAVVGRAPGVLVLTDAFYPGWKAFVDGKETPIYRANYLFRGIALAKGQHKIEFLYRPSSFAYGVVFACFALAIIFASLFAQLQKNMMGVGMARHREMNEVEAGGKS
jgi:hypothetical protein